MNTRRKILVLAAAALAASASKSALAQSFSFGVMSDTQWTVADDGYNPNTVSANVIKSIDQQFIAAKVSLVVAVGDMVDNGNLTNNNTRALYAQDLYNAGIGFYPMRGNHEAANGDPANATSGAELLHAYPQITNGLQNATPSDVNTSVIPAADLTKNAPAAKSGSSFTVGTGFSSPATNATTGGISYSFQYGNTTFMALDQFNGTDYYGSTIASQQSWIDSTLSSRPAGSQAFVFTHKNILGGNHKDNMFGPQYGNDPGDGSGVNVASLSASDQAGLAAKQSAENNFVASMQANNVKYVVSGHDHHEYDSVVTSPDGNSKVHQLITASDSSKFYTPGTPVSANDVPTSQQLGHVGYNIFTVDGPRVTIDYYADTSHAANYYAANGGTFNFTHQSRTGYSLNGQEFIVPEGVSYTSVLDGIAAGTSYGESGYRGTTARILAGTNGSSMTTNYGKALSKAIDTGWAPKTSDASLASDVLTLWGMDQVGTGTGSNDTYVLSMSFDPSMLAIDGTLRLLSRSDSGSWVDAVDLDTGGIKDFVSGAWNSSYGLGTYGVDPSTDTAWAVVNHASSFAVGVPEPTGILMAAAALGFAGIRRRRVMA